jgi:pyridoxal phosphate enzyme (YggS family)
MTNIKKFYDISDKLKTQGVILIAVSKTKPIEDIIRLYHDGQRHFGENKVQELVQKYEQLPKDIKWHMIGHLQSNKVKYIAPFISLIQSVDSLKLLEEINKQAQKNDRIIDCLLQFHVAMEESKFGFDEHEAKSILESETFKNMQNVRLTGVMGMASFVDDKEIIRMEFQKLRSIFNWLKSTYFFDNDYFKEISMGMSSDYEIAIEEGSTMVRIGSLLFGSR